MDDSTEPSLLWATRPIHAFQRPRARGVERIRSKSQLKDPVTKSGWSRMEPKIKELYIEKAYPLRLVQEIMRCIYQFGGSDSAYKRRFSKRVLSNLQSGTAASCAAQTRTKSEPDPPATHVSGVVLEDDDFDLHWHMGLSVPDPLPLRQFAHHEQLLHSVDCFIRGIFDRGSKNCWLADITDFLGPGRNSQGPTLYYQWRSVSDRCHSVALLIRAGQQGKAQTTLEQLFQDLGVLVQHCHPAFIVTFWRLCLRLQGVDNHIDQANAVGRLLSLVRESQSDNKALCRLADSLAAMNKADTRDALRIGYFKAIKTVAELIGDENIMVLEMVSYYCKFFDTHYLVRQTLIAKFEYVWHQTYDRHADLSRPAIAISYAFAYAAYYVFDYPYVAVAMAERLRDTAARHPLLAGPVRWTLEAEAFAFASKTVAEVYRQVVSRTDDLASVADQYAKCCASMQGAIMRLETGDRECQTRAAMMSATLNRWFVEWGLQQQADEEAMRTRRILDGIQGKACTACIRVRYCRNCAPNMIVAQSSAAQNEFEVQAQRRCSWCKPFKQSWLCQKCQVREKRVGWSPSEAWCKAYRGEESDLSRWNRRAAK